MCKVNNRKEYRTTESEGSQAGQRRTSHPFGALRFAVCLPSLVSGCVRLSRRRVRAPQKPSEARLLWVKSADDLYKRQAHAPSSQSQLCYIPDCGFEVGKVVGKTDNCGNGLLVEKQTHAAISAN